MGTKEETLRLIKERGPISGPELAQALSMSRQGVHKQLKRLREEGRIAKDGVTRGATYRLAGGTPESAQRRKRYRLQGLEEDGVFEEFEVLLNLRKSLSPEVRKIARYAFTEMLNNAIEHSGAEFCDVRFRVGPLNLRFEVRDYGIGVFQSIREKWALEDEPQALRELLKGKATTMPERHTGEGIFFTSKVGDRVAFRSHRIGLVFDRKMGETAVRTTRHIAGTEVTFEISRRSRRKLAQVFDEYAPEEYDFSFQKTRIQVKLYGKDYASRSEARRLLSRVREFREVVLDFRDVGSIGQGFADEVFRVFRTQHPEIVIRVANLSPELRAMVEHVAHNEM